MQNQLKGRDRSNGEIRNSLKNRIFMNFNSILASFCFVEVDVSANTENFVGKMCKLSVYVPV